MSEAVDTVRSSEVEKTDSSGNLIRDVLDELKRVSFPSGEDVRNTTIIVIVNVIFFAIFLFLVDQGWTYALQGLEWLINKAVGI